jgi:hypothetical protein
MVEASKETAKQVRTDLNNEVQALQVEMVSVLHEKLESLSGTVMKSEVSMREKSNKATDSALAMKNVIDELVGESLTKNIDAHSGLIENAEWLEAPLVNHVQAVLSEISSISSTIHTSKSSVKTFSRDIVRFEEDPPKIPKRNLPTFTEELSATPGPDELLSSAGKENSVSESISLDKATPLAQPLNDRGVNTITIDDSCASMSSSTTSKRPAEKKSMPASRLEKKAKM